MSEDAHGGKPAIEPEIVSINMAETKITFMDPKGNPLTVESKDPAMTFRWKIEGPGIDSSRVTKVILPPLDYNSNKPYAIEVHMLPHKFF